MWFREIKSAEAHYRKVLGKKKLTTAQKIYCKEAVAKGIKRYEINKFPSPYNPVETKIILEQEEAEEFFYEKYPKYYRVSKSGVKYGGHNVILFRFGKHIHCSGISETVYGKKYPGTNSVIQLYLPTLWKKRVLDKGFAEYDGRLTLDAGLEPDGRYKLIQIKQSRGFSVEPIVVYA